jgi:L-serine/L-threonine ammonia-lyase
MVPPTPDARCVVFIVCGGFKVSLSDAIEFREIVEKDKNDASGDWEVLCPDGERLRVPKKH